MIDSSSLKEICKKYGINYDKLIRNNSNIFEYGQYRKICYVLDYLRDEVKIVPSNIEKCPSILYFEVGNIISNYEFLKKEQITNYSVEGCLHILSTEPSKLKETYNYILENYGIRYLNARTTILSVPVSKIQEIEIKFPEFKKKNVIQAACSGSSIEEIEKIVEVCKKNKIELTGAVFQRLAGEIEKIVEVCKKNRIEITGSVFKKSAKEIEKIVEVCKANGIEITGSVFCKSAKQLQENIDYISENYGKEYIKPLIVSKSIKTLKKVLPYLQEKGVLETLLTSSSILALTLEEIKERQAFIERTGEKMVTIVAGSGVPKFNSIFGLSRKNYAKRVEKEKNKGIEI